MRCLAAEGPTPDVLVVARRWAFNPDIGVGEPAVNLLVEGKPDDSVDLFLSLLRRTRTTSALPSRVMSISRIEGEEALPGLPGKCWTTDATIRWRATRCLTRWRGGRQSRWSHLSRPFMMIRRTLPRSPPMAWLPSAPGSDTDASVSASSAAHGVDDQGAAFLLPARCAVRGLPTRGQSDDRLGGQLVHSDGRRQGPGEPRDAGMTVQYAGRGEGPRPV